MMAPEAPLVALRMRPVKRHGVTESWAELVVETVAGCRSWVSERARLLCRLHEVDPKINH